MDAVIKEKGQREKPKYNLWQNSAYMVALAWKKRKSVLLLGSILAMLRVISNLIELFIAPSILKKIEIISPFSELLMTIGFFAASLIIIKSLDAYVSSNVSFGRIDLRIGLVRSIHRKLSTTSYPNTEDTSVLNKLDRANMAVNNNSDATEAIWKTLVDILRNSAGFIIYLTLLSFLDPFLLVIIIVTTTIGYYFNRWINQWKYRHRDEEAEYSKRMNYITSSAEDIILGKDIRIFGMRPWLEEVYSKTLGFYQAFTVRGEKVYIWADIMEALLTFLRNGLAYIYLIRITLKGDLAASEFLLYFTAVSYFTTQLMGILSSFEILHKQSLDISILREFFEIPEPFCFEDGKALKPDLYRAYEIRLENVSFRYPGADEDTLHNINLTISPGEKLGIVGLNGAGKTTLVKLICGFYDPTEGEVLLNGVNIQEYNRRDYYSHFTAVFQQFSILEATLAENVAQIDEGIDYDKVNQCIERAGLTKKVESLPNGLETYIGRKVYEDGAELSGGEMQRLMLARALYKDAPIIVLDEPTAALDPIAENNIYQRYNEMTAGRTSLYISHRLASTRFCDRIIYLESGMLVEEGTHDSLLNSDGKYANLYGIQSHYYREGDVIDGK